MARYVAFLRGVNVGGKKMVSMEALRKLMEGLGFGEVRTLLQSGNVVFGVKGRARPEDVARKIQEAIALEMELESEVIVRSAEELRAVVKGNPYAAEAKADPGHLVAVFLKGECGAGSADELRKMIKGRERFEVKGRELFVVYPDGIGTSKFTHTVIERVLGIRGTARNWNTVMKLMAMVEG